MNSAPTLPKWTLSGSKRRAAPRFAGLIPPLICLAACAITAALLTMLAPGHNADWRLSAATSVICFGIVLFVVFTVAVAALLSSGLPSRAALFPLSRRLAVAGVWFAPAALLVPLGEVAALLTACILAIVWAKCFRDFYVPAHIADLKTKGVASVMLHAGTAGLLFGYRAVGEFLLGLACFCIVWEYAGGAIRRRRQAVTGASPVRFLSHAVLAFLITLTIQVLKPPQGARGSRGNGDSSIPLSGAAPGDRRNMHSGVILRPEAQRVTLLAPVPRSVLKDPRQAANKRPLSIPFSGDYWFYYSFTQRKAGRRTPMKPRPPASSMLERGTPLTWTMTSVGAWLALVMKAHQPLEPSIDVSCCQTIDVAIDNADPEPETVTLELVLQGDGVDASLGEAPISPRSGKSVVSFGLANASKVRKVDAFEVVVHVEPWRKNRSSVGIAIDRFDLRPR